MRLGSPAVRGKLPGGIGFAALNDMRKALLISTVVAALGGGTALWGQAANSQQDPSAYSQEVIDAAMAKMRAKQALREAEEASLPPEQRAEAQRQRQQQEEVARLRRNANAAQAENDALRQQVAQLTREVQQLRRSVQQINDSIQQAQANGRMQQQQRDRSPYPYPEEQEIYIYQDGFYGRNVNPLTTQPPEGLFPPIQDVPRPAPDNTLNPALTPRNFNAPVNRSLNPAQTPRNFNAPTNRSLNPGRSPGNAISPGGASSAGRQQQ